MARGVGDDQGFETTLSWACCLSVPNPRTQNKDLIKRRRVFKNLAALEVLWQFDPQRGWVTENSVNRVGIWRDNYAGPAELPVIG